MFHGSMVALVTPMLEDGLIDVDALRSLVEWHIQEGTQAIVVLGTTGEVPTIHYQERPLIMQQVIEQVHGRVPVIAGTGTNSTEMTIQLTKEAMECGVDACLLVTPYYNKPTQEGLYQHFKAVSTAVPIPQILYNVPSRTGCDLKPATLARLVSCSNIVGLKEATGDMARLHEIKAVVDSDIDLYSGDDASCLDFMLGGGRGVISVTANVVPKQMRALCDAALMGHREQATALNNPLMGLHKNLFVESNPIPVKWALHRMGKISKGIRLPLTPLSAEYHALLDHSLDEASSNH